MDREKALKELKKNVKNKNLVKHMLAAEAVMRGLAEYFEIDSSLVRLLWIIFLLIGGTGILAHIIAWIIIPER